MERGYLPAEKRVKDRFSATMETTPCPPLFDDAYLSSLPVRCTGVGDRCVCATCSSSRLAAIEAQERAQTARREASLAAERERVRLLHAEPWPTRIRRWRRWARAAELLYGRDDPRATLPWLRDEEEEGGDER